MVNWKVNQNNNFMKSQNMDSCHIPTSTIKSIADKRSAFELGSDADIFSET